MHKKILALLAALALLLTALVITSSTTATATGGDDPPCVPSEGTDAEFSDWSADGFTEWQHDDTLPADPDGQSGEDNPLNLQMVGSPAETRKDVTQEYVPPTLATEGEWTNQQWHVWPGGPIPNTDPDPLVSAPAWLPTPAEPRGQHLFAGHTPNVPYDVSAGESGLASWFLWKATWVAGTEYDPGQPEISHTDYRWPLLTRTYTPGTDPVECPPPTEVCEADFAQGEGTADDMWEITWGQQAGSTDAATFTMSSFGGLTSLNGGAVPGYMTPDWTWLYVTRAQVEDGRTIDYGFADGTAIHAVVSDDEAGCPSVTWTTTPPGEDKPWICHPVNGKGELGNGWNLINPNDPSSHIHEDDYPVEPYWEHMSNDGLRHDRYADLKDGEDGKDEDDYTCPGGELDEIEEPGKPAITDPCGPRNIRWTEIPGDTATVNWTENENGSLTATPIFPAVFPGEDQSVTFTLPADSNTPCPPNEIGLPATPTQSDPCGPDNATWNLPADTQQLDWNLSNGVLTVTILTPDTVFSNSGGATSKNYGLAIDSNTPCPPNEIALPAAAGISDPCDPGNAEWIVPGDDETFQWDLVDGELIVTILADNTVFEGTDETTHNFGEVVEVNIEPCDIGGVQLEIPAEPGIKDPCDADNATWVVPDDNNTLVWTLTDGVLSVEIIASDTVFEGTQDTTYSFGEAEETNTEPCIKGEQGNNNNPDVEVEVKGEQGVVPTAVDAGLGAENNPIPAGRNPLWLLVVGGGLGLMGSAGLRRRSTANR